MKLLYTSFGYKEGKKINDYSIIHAPNTHDTGWDGVSPLSRRGRSSNRRPFCSHGVNILGFTDPQRDQSEIEQLGIQPPTLAYLRGELLPKYEAAGFEPVEFGPLAPAAWPQLTSSWAKRLRNNTERSLLALVLRAKGE